MDFFNYTIKCIIRNIVRLCFKPRNLAIIIVSLVVFFILSFPHVFAAEKTPTFKYWENKAFSDNGKEVKVVSYNGLKGKAVYIEPMTSGVLNLGFKSDEFHVANFIGNEPPVVGDTVTDYFYTSTSGLLSFDATIGTLRETGYWIVYYSVDMTSSTRPSYDQLNDMSTSGQIDSSIKESTAEIVTSQNETKQAIESQTDAINTQTAVLDEQNNFLQDSNVNDESMDIKTDSFNVDDKEGVENFFTSTLEHIKSIFLNIDDTVETIEIPLPHTTQKLVLSSDLLSKHIVNTSIYSLIQVFWWFVIGRYLIMFCKRIIDWLSTGEIAEKGPSAFIRYLDQNNELIKTYMM